MRQVDLQQLVLLPDWKKFVYKATDELDAGITVSFDRLTVSVDAGVDFAAACPPDVVADAVQVKAKKIEMISVASIVFFMLENLLFFTNRHSKGGCVRCFFERKNTSFIEKERTLR